MNVDKGCIDDSELGLAASVWSKDLDRALRIAEQIQAGSGMRLQHILYNLFLTVSCVQLHLVWINEHQVTHWNQVRLFSYIESRRFFHSK